MTNPTPDFTPKYSDELKDTIRTFLLEGNKAIDIAETCGVKYHVVNDVKKKMLRNGELQPKVKKAPRASLVRPGQATPAPVHTIGEEQHTEAVRNGAIGQATTIRENQLRAMVADRDNEIVSLKALLKRYMS